MKTLFRLSYDDLSDDYVVDYRVTSGYYKGQPSTRRFSRFSDMVTFFIMYISNNLLKID